MLWIYEYMSLDLPQVACYCMQLIEAEYLTPSTWNPCAWFKFEQCVPLKALFKCLFVFTQCSATDLPHIACISCDSEYCITK